MARGDFAGKTAEAVGVEPGLVLERRLCNENAMITILQKSFGHGNRFGITSCMMVAQAAGLKRADRHIKVCVAI